MHELAERVVESDVLRGQISIGATMRHLHEHLSAVDFIAFLHHGRIEVHHFRPEVVLVPSLFNV